ncbi:metallophosphoesterase family protein [Azospirillum halopraeferens]|uniref:metallophosphoesterase family protein n=1 Tax=Azospirillum halopraeferens TaxID=34010 RepID=UPI000405C3A6|nr:metallophosphoesterase [Azospirillum halopraeferens]
MTEERTTADIVRVAAIGDIHVAETAVHPYRDLFAEMAERADVLVLAGDLTNHGKPAEAAVLAEDLRGLSVPVLAVLGNHDLECGEVAAMKEVLVRAGVHFLDENPCEIKGVGFVGVKGFGGGFERMMLDAFGEPAIKQFVSEAVQEAMHLESALRQVEAERSFVVLHYAPIAGTVQGEPPEIYPFLGSSRLAETIDRFHGQVRAVVHGHAHHGRYAGATPRGTPVYNVARTIEKEGGRAYALIEV